MRAPAAASNRLPTDSFRNRSISIYCAKNIRTTVVSQLRRSAPSRRRTAARFGGVLFVGSKDGSVTVLRRDAPAAAVFKRCGIDERITDSQPVRGLWVSSPRCRHPQRRFVLGAPEQQPIGESHQLLGVSGAPG